MYGVIDNRFEWSVDPWKDSWIGSSFASVRDRHTGLIEDGQQRVFKCMARRDVPGLIRRLKERASLLRGPVVVATGHWRKPR